MRRFLHCVLGALGLIGGEWSQAGAQDVKADSANASRVVRAVLAAPIPTSPSPLILTGAKDSKDAKDGRPGLVTFEDSSRRPWTVSGGVDALFLHPHFSSNPALSETTSRTTVAGLPGQQTAVITSTSTSS